MRVIGLDYGEARIGAAVSDVMGIIANTLETICEKDPERQMDAVCALVRQYDAKVLVVGHPKRMDGTEGHRATVTEDFARRAAEACNVQLVLWDERLTSAQAHRLLEEGGVSGKKRKGKVDAISANLILQSYLDSKGGCL